MHLLEDPIYLSECAAMSRAWIAMVDAASDFEGDSYERARAEYETHRERVRSHARDAALNRGEG